MTCICLSTFSPRSFIYKRTNVSSKPKQIPNIHCKDAINLERIEMPHANLPSSPICLWYLQAPEQNVQEP